MTDRLTVLAAEIRRAKQWGYKEVVGIPEDTLERWAETLAALSSAASTPWQPTADGTYGVPVETSSASNIPDPLAEAIAAAPLDDEPLTDDDIAALAEARAAKVQPAPSDASADLIRTAFTLMRGADPVTGKWWALGPKDIDNFMECLASLRPAPSEVPAHFNQTLCPGEDLRECGPPAPSDVVMPREVVRALKAAKVALYHEAPSGCWATGPLTGNRFEDLVVCPGCRALHLIDKALAQGGE